MYSLSGFFISIYAEYCKGTITIMGLRGITQP